ncbi:MAG: 3-phosphoshikimate 1-carboxyvinyltransferase [Pseudomonadales bacterium]|nr:3-phosphoshikimate 1-carboxyvinyltransferase [Pseudomonadales bacterium]MBO6658182.1 3-phosphoshikimate 1-carboxyvinyltransferase [Pseudomonadales bacterium]
MKQLTMTPISHVEGEVVLPGSKSLSNRALLLSALSSGNTTLTNLLRSDDTKRMVDALRQLGVNISISDDRSECTVEGFGGLFLPEKKQELFLGNAGTAIRPLTAVLSLINQEFLIDGDKYMRERPIEHLVDALRQLGAEIEYLEKDGCPPLKLRGGLIQGKDIRIRGDISSQYLTALLMALPLAEGDANITVIGEQVSKPYLDITLGMLEIFGGTANHENYQKFHIPGGQRYKSPGAYMIEGDASSASYFFGAAAISGGPVRVHGLGKNSVQGDYQFLDTIEQMGAKVDRQENWTDVSSSTLKGIDVDLNHIPDAAMTIAAMALFAEGKTTIRNVYNWRVKETDRMHAMSEGLRRLGAEVETTDDTITINPPTEIRPAEIDTYADHRVAMCFSLAALGRANVTINDPDCTRKTFPDYFHVLQSISH